MNLRVAYLVIVVFGCACNRPQGQPVPTEPLPPVKVTASIDKAVATTGDILTFTIQVDRDAQVTATLPEPGADIAGFRILDAGSEPPITRHGRTLERRWYKLRADLVGSYILPPVVAHYRTPSPTSPAASPEPVAEPAAPTDAPAKLLANASVSTSAIFVEVKSVLPQDGEAKDIRDLKPLQPMPAARWPYWLGGGGLLVLVMAIAGYIWWRRQRKALLVPPVPPHEVAYAALDALRRTDFADPEAVRRYFFGLSEIVRTYVEGRFGLNATDLTTEEILPRLLTLEAVPSAERNKLKETLVAADQVKFAEHRAGKSEIERAYELALSFIEATAAPELAEPSQAGDGHVLR